MVIHVKLCGPKPLVFDAEDVKQLRSQHRIVGTLIGTLPRLPLQNAFLGLPLQLLPEETALLVAKNLACMDAPWSYPNSKDERLRYRVFEYLWSREYYITSGLKFGGDFLVYLGDPMRFHSHFIVSAKDRNSPIAPLDVIAMGRLATNVKKTFVLVSPPENAADDNSTMDVFSIEWAGF
ncbi:tRNA intron endonuclease [Fennellomyces sp. T-0311]|nr:tRNA intron endonuclease [Fennellomyces sp. T-0311]